MLFTCPNSSCAEYGKPYSTPLMERMQYNELTHSLHIYVHCPHCAVPLLLCDNCSTLLQLPEDECTFCSICGFCNIVSAKLKSGLSADREQLSSIRFEHVSMNTLRLIQRLIHQKLYVESKTEEYHRLKAELDETTNPDEKKILAMKSGLTHKQLTMMNDEYVTRTDGKLLQEIFGYNPMLNEFTESHLHMLESLYHDANSEEVDHMFTLIDRFLGSLPDLMEYKRDFYFYDTAVKNEHLIEPVSVFLQPTLSNLKRSQIDNLPFRILQSHQQQQKNKWIELRKCFLELIPIVNRRLSGLLGELSVRLETVNDLNHFQISTTPFSENFITAVTSTTQNKSLNVEQIKNKITLLRRLSKQLTVIL